MSIRLPIGGVKKAVGHMSLEFKRDVLQSLNLGVFDTKMVLIAIKVEEITMRMSTEREKDKGPLS